jgi:hypothetical protein
MQHSIWYHIAIVSMILFALSMVVYGLIEAEKRRKIAKKTIADIRARGPLIRNFSTVWQEESWTVDQDHSSQPYHPLYVRTEVFEADGFKAGQLAEVLIRPVRKEEEEHGKLQGIQTPQMGGRRV